MLILAKSAETIFKVSQALVKHAVSACKLGLVRLACGVTFSFFHRSLEKVQTHRVYRSMYAEAV
jgi:hypothetical protein